MFIYCARIYHYRNEYDFQSSTVYWCKDGFNIIVASSLSVSINALADLDKIKSLRKSQSEGYTIISSIVKEIDLGHHETTTVISLWT